MPLTPKGYTTKAEVEDYLFANLDAAYDTALDDLIAKAESYIEQKCRRRFDQHAGPMTLAGRHGDVLVIPDTRSLSNVRLDALGASAPSDFDDEDYDWMLEPVGAPDSGRPYTRLRLLNGFSFPEPGKVTLTGTFGWDAVPADIRHAATMLVGEATRQWRDALVGDAQSYSLGDYSVTFTQTSRDPQFRSWLAPYVKARVR